MKRSLQTLWTIHDRLTQASAVVAAIGLMSIVTFYVYEVITRYVFNSPTAWVSDFVSYALAASVFLALPKVTKDKGHVAVTILVDIIPEKAANIVHTIISLIGFGCLSLITWISFLENIRQFTKNIETLAIIPIPQWWISSFITFGLALSALYMLRYATPNHRKNESLLEGSSN
jgi:TRAP-type C4-dicarboxylate transport system permease small subunit